MAPRIVPKPEPPEPPEDEFLTLVQREIKKLLELPLDPKDKNAAILNAIRFIAARNKLLSGDEGDFWGSDR